jgi:hypothetical protein
VGASRAHADSLTAARSGLCRAGDVLARKHPEFVVSKYKLRQAEGISLVRSRRESGNQLLAFAARPFVLCGLPVRRPPATQVIHERRNGQFTLQITSHPDFGLPFGQDRIVPIFLATLAVQQNSPIVRFKSASAMLETFGMQKGGKEYRRLVGAFERIFGATIFFGTEKLNGHAEVVHRCRFNFIREAQIWFNRGDGLPSVSAGFENEIVLSDEFYKEVIAHPIPTDLEAVRVLSSAPAILDLFMWLSYRCFFAKGRESIPLFGAFGLVHELGSIEYSRPRRFRAMLNQWLKTIRALWPDCPVRISSDGQNLVIERATSILPRSERLPESIRFA